jgi:hypothetical protein
MEQSYPSFSGLRYLAVTALWILSIAFVTRCAAKRHIQERAHEIGKDSFFGSGVIYGEYVFGRPNRAGVR